jgi:hemolysin D
LHAKVINVDAIVRDKSPKQGGALSESSEPVSQEPLYTARVSLDDKQMQVGQKGAKRR